MPAVDKGMTSRFMVLLYALWSIHRMHCFKSPIQRRVLLQTLSPRVVDPLMNGIRHRLYSTSTDESSLNDLVSKISVQGNHVRDLKASKADKDIVKSAVDELLALKAKYKQVTGQEFGKEVKQEDIKPSSNKSDEAPSAPKSKGKSPVKEDAKEVTMTIDEIRQVRLDKVQAMRDNSINPFAYVFQQTHKASVLQETFQHLPNGQESTETVVSIAGRIMVSLS